jgi:hypothetical protein
VKGAPITGMRASGADAVAAAMAMAVAAPSLSNALDVPITKNVLPVSNALDAASRDRCHWAHERGAPPGRTPHRNARGPVDPALSILGGSKMTTQ